MVAHRKITLFFVIDQLCQKQVLTKEARKIYEK